jgi:hypothetical protein
VNVVRFAHDAEPEWRTFVEAHPDRSLGHLPGIAAFERLTSGATNRSLMVRDDSGRLVGVVPLFEIERRDLRAFRTRVLTSGTHLPSGPLLATSLSAKQQQAATKAVAACLIDEAHRCGAHTLSIAYPTVIKGRPAVESLGVYPLRAYGFRESNVVAMVVDLARAEDELLADVDGKARNQLKRCRNAGAHARVLTSRDEWLGCEPLARMTLGAVAPSSEAMAALWDLFIQPGQAAAVATFHEERIASVVVITLFGAAAYYWFSFNAFPPPIPGTNGLALWEAVLTARRAGHAMFELGSMEFDDPKQIRIARFKAQFGGRLVYTLAGSIELRPLRRAAVQAAAALIHAVRGRRTTPGTPPAPDDG